MFVSPFNTQFFISKDTSGVQSFLWGIKIESKNIVMSMFQTVPFCCYSPKVNQSGGKAINDCINMTTNGLEV